VYHQSDCVIEVSLRIDSLLLSGHGKVLGLFYLDSPSQKMQHGWPDKTEIEGVYGNTASIKGTTTQPLQNPLTK
jgi:hypothetical protein